MFFVISQDHVWNELQGRPFNSIAALPLTLAQEDFSRLRLVRFSLVIIKNACALHYSEKIFCDLSADKQNDHAYNVR